MNGFELKHDGNKLSVVFEGDLTVSVVTALKPALQKSLGDDVGHVEFDLGKTVFIDSTGIGLLIATYNSLAKKNGTVSVVSVSEDIFHLLQSMRIEKRLCVTKR